MTKVESSEKTEFIVSGADDRDGLRAFLSEPLSTRDRDGIVLKRFDVRFEGDKVDCLARCELPDLSMYKLKCEVRAVDHGTIEIDRDGLSVTVIFDL